mgnify:CR=1 FL=1
MTSVKLLNESELRRAVALDLDAVNCVEKGFVALAAGGVIMPPILSMVLEDHNGEVDVKTAYVPGIDSFAIKIAPGFFDNPSLGLPSTSGLMVLHSAKTGRVEAVLLDNGYLTDVRTAAAGAVAARHLARADAQSACIIGAGMQAQLQLQALCLVRPITRASLWARDPQKATVAAQKATARLGIEISAVKHVVDAVAQADVIVTTTPSSTPVLNAAWLRPGQHVTAMGSDQEHKNELEPACFEKADLYVPDRLSQTRVLGELRSAIEAGVVDADAPFCELGEVAGGKAPGRSDDADITIADLTGTGVQDTAIATFALQRAVSNRAGLDFEN